MTRTIKIAAAQLGPVGSAQSRTDAVNRMIDLMEDAAAQGCKLIVFPELALTTFFPRWFMESEAEIEQYFEEEMPGPDTQPLFECAKRLGVSFHLGYAELVRDGNSTHKFNTAILVNELGEIIGKYRKIHLPGHAEHEPERPFQHLEKRYFQPGDLGFPTFTAFGGKVGMLICNDRRWPEAFRVLGLQGAELIMLGYNTPAYYAPVPENSRLVDFHNHLSMQAGAYQNGAWVVAAAKAGTEDGCDLIGGSCIITPTGEILAEAQTLDDELVIADCDLDACAKIKGHIFNFSAHRRPENYALITAPMSRLG